MRDQHAQQRFVMACLAVQAGQHRPQQIPFGIFAKRPFQRGHGPVTLTAVEIGLRELDDALTLVGRRSRGHPQFQPGRSGERLARRFVKSRERIHGRRVGGKLRDFLVRADGARRIAKLLFEEQRGLAPALGGWQRIALLFQLAGLPCENIGELGKARTRTQKLSQRFQRGRMARTIVQVGQAESRSGRCGFRRFRPSGQCRAARPSARRWYRRGRARAFARPTNRPADPPLRRVSREP
jgi:hypothetical protein